MLTTEVPERGGDLPTIVDPEAQGRFAGLQTRDPNVTWPALQARVGLVFSEFQAAWSSRDLLRMRPYFTDAPSTPSATRSRRTASRASRT